MEDRFEFTALPRVATSECLTLNAVSEANGWQTDYRQLGGGSFHAWSDLFTCGSLLLSDRYCNQEMTATAIAPPGHVALFIPQNPIDKGILQGKVLGATDVALLSPRSEVFYRTPADVRMMVVTIPITRLRRSMTAVAHDDTYCFTGETRVITLADNSLANLSSHVKHILQAAQFSSTDVGFSVCLQELEEQFVGTLSLALSAPNELEHGARARRNRLRYLQQARDFIEVNLDLPLGLETLARVVGVTPRTLSTACRETLGITLVQYISNRRLIAANYRLRHSDKTQTTVTDTALTYGFVHMGRFSRDYHILFGEYPLKTLSASV